MKIYLVDDDEDGRFVTGRYLQKYFPIARITAFSSAEEALAAMGDKPPAAVVTDHLLPSMNGLEFCREVRARYPDIPLVMMSGLDNVAGEALTAGASAFLSSGSAKELGATLTKLL